MLIFLLLATLAASIGVSYGVVHLFSIPIRKILEQLLADKFYVAWTTYINFAIYVTGIVCGARLNQMERYVADGRNSAPLVGLSFQRCLLEIYRSAINSLEGLTWLLLAFFSLAIIAYVLLPSFNLPTAPKKKDP